MGQPVAFQLDEGKAVVIEVDDVASHGLQRSGRHGAPDKAEKTYDQALNQVMPAAERTVQRIQALNWSPASLTLEFGIKFNAKAGALIASTALEGNLKVSLTWNGASEGMPGTGTPPS